MRTVIRGNQAEAAVVDVLRADGYKILDQNWKTKVCEIDIVAEKSRVIYFVEAKYRTSQDQGDGLAYITPKKLNQMRFASRIWVQNNKWEGDWRLLAASISWDGRGYIVQEIIELE